MFKTTMRWTLGLFVLSFAVPSALADDFSETLSRVAALHLSRYDYVLGKRLSEQQKEIARKNPLEIATPGTYKFKDRNLTVVADRNTHKVVLLYEQHSDITAEKTREMIGALYMDFGAPTVMAHNQVVYWVFGSNGKLTREQYRKVRKTGAALNVLATIKLSSSRKILGKDPQENERGDVYYIISSKAILKYLERRH